MIILHTNDLHGHLTEWQGVEGSLMDKTIGGVACLASAIKRERSKGDAILLLDAGDLIGDTMIADLTKGQALITAFNELRYDAMTFGNHEPDFGVAVLRERMKQAEFPFVAANLRSGDTQQYFAKPYIIKDVGGLSVGILGLTYPKTPWTTSAKNIVDLDFEDPVTAATRELPKLRREGAQLIVVLSHLGLSGDKNLAQAVSGIDVIVGGHSHNRMEQAEQVGSTLIVQAGAHGSDLGRLELTLSDGRIASHSHSLIPLDHAQIPADEAMEIVVGGLLAPHQRMLEEVVGAAAGNLVRAQTLGGQQARKRDEESPVDSLFADIVRSELRADISFLPGVGYGVPIPAGPITAAQLRQLVPHEGKLITMSLRGTDVREVIEQAIENVVSEDPKLKVGGMIQVSGIRLAYDPAEERGKRLLSITVAGAPLVDDAEYQVVTNSMLAGGGHRQQALRGGKNRKEHTSQYETIKNWIMANSPVKAPDRGRIAATAPPSIDLSS